MKSTLLVHIYLLDYSIKAHSCVLHAKVTNHAEITESREVGPEALGIHFAV